MDILHLVPQNIFHAKMCGNIDILSEQYILYKIYCSRDTKIALISCLEPCIVPMETKIIFFLAKMETLKFHLSNGIGVAIQENEPKRY